MGPDKCAKLHIAKRNDQICKNIVKVHNEIMKSESETRFLGNILSVSDGINKTVSDRHSRGIGIITQLSSLLKSISLGPFYFNVALILRDAMLVNSILVNCESWNFMTKKQIESFESTDVNFMMNCFSASSKTVRDAYYIETGSLKVRYLIAKRRFMYLKNILSRNKDELIFKVYQAQKLQKTKKDWYNMIQSEKEYFSLKIDDSEIANMSKRNFKVLVNECVNKRFVSDLRNSGKSKAQGILSTMKVDTSGKISMQPYLATNRLSVHEKKTLFLLRCRNLNTKSNMKSSFDQDDMSCRLCKLPEIYEDENHLIQCSELEIQDDQQDFKFEYVFADIEKQIKTVKLFSKIIERRKLLFELRGI